MTMNGIRNVAVAVAFAMAAPLAGAADKSAAAVITGAIAPGIYGRVDMANRTKPPLVYQQPMFIEQPENATGVIEPVYLHVPPDHAKNWKKFCEKYEACDKPVYFVKSAEYEPGYKPPEPEKSEKTGKRKFRSGW
jgi:hypothetical protein